MGNKFYLIEIVFGLAIAFAHGETLAQPARCTNLSPQPQYSSQEHLGVGCECGEHLKGVTLTLNKPFQLRAACGLYWSRNSEIKSIDLSREKASFDRYSKEGELPHGQLLLAGSTTVEGILTYSPGPAGEYWFQLAHSIAQKGPAIGLLGNLKLTGEHTSQELRVPNKLQQVGKGELCWKAFATIDIRDVWLTIGQTGEAGAYPSKYVIRQISGHKRC